MEFYAHSAKQRDRGDWQPLAAHLVQVGARAAEHAAPFGGQSLAQVAGRLHDLGKYTQKFQARLDGDPTRVDHASWGARIARERYGNAGTLIAYGIAGHHTGLADGRPGHQAQSRPSLYERLSDDYRERELPPLLPDWERELALPAKLTLPDGFIGHTRLERRPFQLSLLARMVFSCLVDADFTDTDDFYRRVEGRPSRAEEAGTRPTLAQLRERLDAHLAGFPREGGINPLRAQILHQVRAKAGMRPGLFSLTVPTGGGKTLASLAFALDHAIAHAQRQGLRRVIYVIPFTSIVEQTVQVFRHALGVQDRDDVVLEHHSAFFDDPQSAPEAISKRRLAMENWDAPIVVTTAVQFFESLFADRPARCRKLHNIAGSVVVLDEAQTLPHALLRPCVALLDELARNYRVSPVLCTATQPALRLDQGFKGGLEHVQELVDDPPALYARLQRVHVRHVGTLDDDALADHLHRREQVLCIVNNRRHARHLFDAIADQPGARHLTTLMHARHRSTVLAELREDLKAGRPCRLVATSLIEAGVDVDFPAVLRAEAGLDSIAQAAGRCNREGRRQLDASEVLVFAPANRDWAPPKELELFAEVFRGVERAHRENLLAMDAVAEYFAGLYRRLGDGRLDREDLLGLLRDAGIDALPLDTLARKFKLINTTMRPLIVPYAPGRDEEVPEVADILRQLEHAEQVGVAGAARRLQPWLVQVPEQTYQALWQAHAIAAVAQARYGEQFMRLVNPRLYDARFGLHWENPQFLDTEKNVW
ncbi:CRISPR-associated helicase/endonuclease Cas3 [Xanthomonas hyacinthi]|uniref:CRISPR-associated helicase/endonuclease Cas3 n=1 Tax=Xanthomonas hyacinthi TaxID=56455 RepID=A0A2S7EW40_9XANT|nr:CRISPR-associated helicase/endonuclease Cas3 [Xanthomonas hyacinthi]KLD79931.1 CRISPR-associated protein Cas3 [Xanthomonas hyacinthi DSM 19077]PPU97319.1 CRISPR-associated helicase/endonuclease Cas3 [Xanthomonas hyacinthi]QGY76379.1 CRISPR-associated helicase/endonuclease Cas3 [Xanthomonas hyacinthi]